MQKKVVFYFSKKLNIKFTFLLLFILGTIKMSAANYYFSSSTGDDTRTGSEAQNKNTPWKTLNKLKQFSNNLVAGDSLFFKCGETFYGNIVINQSGMVNKPIVYTSYDKGNKPVISGFVHLTGWTSSGNAISYVSFTALSKRNMVIVNDSEKAMGRFPNADANNNGYLTINSNNGNTSITSSQLTGNTDWTGAEAVIRKARWVLDRNVITQQAGNTIYYNSESGYGSSPGYGFFIQNNIKTLDQFGEWFYDASANKMHIFFGKINPTSCNVQVSSIDTLVSISGNNNLSFINLTFTGANNYAFKLKDAQNIKIYNCNISFTGMNAIDANNTNNISVHNCLIEYANNIALTGANSSNTSVIQDTINFSGSLAGMGFGDSGSYEGILINGDNNTISFNEINNTGYIPITFGGSNVTISRNLINRFAFVKDDGGGIYTWNNTNNAANRTNQVIKSNIITNGIGAGTGTDNSSYLPANGIYADDNSSGITISSNTIAGCAQYGLFIHNAHDIIIDSNTVYNNHTQLALVHDNIAADKPVKNITSSGNIFLSKNISQTVALFSSSNNDVAQFGIFNSNCYCRPIDDSLTINVRYNENQVQYNNMVTLSEWKELFNNDRNSRISPKHFLPFTIKKFNGNNQFNNGAFNSDVNGLYCYSPNNNCIIQWQSYKLDAGSLSVSFQPLAGNTNKGSLIIGIGGVTAKADYVTQFSMLGLQQYKNIEVYLRQSVSPYKDLSPRLLLHKNSLRTENELLLIPFQSEKNASLVFDIAEQSTPLYFDNISIKPADVIVSIMNQ